MQQTIRLLYYTPTLDQIQTAQASPNTVLSSIKFKSCKTMKNAPFYIQHPLVLATLLHKTNDSNKSQAKIFLLEIKRIKKIKNKSKKYTWLH